MEEDIRNLDKTVKFLKLALSISFALNVGLIVNFGFFVLRNQSLPVVSSSEIVDVDPSPSIAKVVHEFLSFSFSELKNSLKNETPLEEGYKVRDIALALLTNFHYFNLEKALSGVVIQKRTARFEKKETGEQFELILYPALQNAHFEAISLFLDSEKWPFTTEGLFQELKKNGYSADRSLKEAFYKTQEFELIEMLLKRNKLTANREMVLKLICTSEYLLIQELVQKMVVNQDFSIDVLQHWLRQLIALNSSVASVLLVELDPSYVLKNLEDSEVSRVIRGLKIKTDRALFFLRELVSSIRSDLIRKEAAARLYLLYTENSKSDLNHSDLIKKLLPSKKEEESSLLCTEYRVKEGDTLWKIGRQFKLTVDQLVDWNHLDKKKPLKTGTKLTLVRPD